jgi:prepilin-type N-terminal cleavage/methylation domain-containing protein
MLTKIQPKALLDQRGLTLVEIIAVLVILGILTGLVVPRFIDLEAGAKQKAIDAAIGELNGREHLKWADRKTSDIGYTNDTHLFDEMEYTLGPDYTWNPGDPTESGGAINFKGVAVNLIRIVSEASKPAKWERSP